MSDATREGGCACGQTRYRVTGDPIFVNNCYCTLCQRQTGSTSVVNAFFEAEAFELVAGEATRHVVEAGSGGDHVIMRCRACGTALWSHYPRLGALALALRVGTLDDPGAFRPDVAIFVADRMPWVELPQNIPHFDAYYRPGDVLPPERMERLKALAARAAAAS